jgi:uncharacterized phage protein gp47/JayE
VLGDVLTFYQERIANEGYLRTASETLSLNALAALIGYQPRPALGASTTLAFTLDPNARTVIPAGSGSRSVPNQNELPQIFETSSDLEARQEWNTLQPAMTAPPAINSTDDAKALTTLTIAGTTANLKAGDRLLFLFGDDAQNPVVRMVTNAQPGFTSSTTTLSLQTSADTLTAPRTALQNALIAARSTVPPAGSAPSVDVNYLQPLLDRTDGIPAALIVTDLPDIIDRLTEFSALAAVHDPAAVVGWYGTEIAAVIDAARQVLTAAETITRSAPSEVLATRALAQQTLCPPTMDRKPDGAECDAGDALVGLTPMLAWLRKPPSQPPRAARDAVGTVAELFRPDADAQTRLLVAADPRLAAGLRAAWANQQLTAPPGLSALLVLRTRATFVTETSSGTVEQILDAVYDNIHAGDWVVFGDQPYKVTSAEQNMRSVPINGGSNSVSVPATYLQIEGTTAFTAGTPVYAGGENLTIAGDPITDDIAGGEIELGRVYDGLLPGRWIVVKGERTDVPFTSGVQAAELAMLAGVRQRVDAARPGSSVGTILELTGDLSYRYRRDTVTLYGNVIDATQGETRRQVLGGGDAGTPNQSISIRQTNTDYPLTVLPADNPSGAHDTLDVMVSGSRWASIDLLAAAAATDHVYGTTVAADQSLQVQFGDGVHGARPPTGTDNIVATLRVGAGRGGNVVADQITQLAARPLGVSAVTNPLPATGGAYGDGPDDLRATAPLRVLALDRLVSVRDYEDFTRARAGIGKASAAKLFDGHRHVVHVTIAGIGDAPIDPGSQLATVLRASLIDFGDIGLTVDVAPRELVLLIVSASIKVTADHSWDDVEPAVRAALLDTFSFAKRALGQDAYLSEAVAAMQAVPGVDYVDLDVFQGISQSVMPVELLTLGQTAKRNRVVTAEAAQFVAEYDTALSGETLSAFALRAGLTVDELCELNPRLTGITLTDGQELVVRTGIRPAQLAMLPDGVPEALTLRRIA